MPYHVLLAQYSEITKPEGQPSAVRHMTRPQDNTGITSSANQIRSGAFGGRKERVSEDGGGRDRAIFEGMLLVAFTPAAKERRKMATLRRL